MEIKRIDLTENLEKYSREWYKMMTVIWKDKLEQLGVLDTGNLINSVDNKDFQVIQSVLDVAFKFLEYGIFVDNGTGNGFYKGNDGKLVFMDEGKETGVNRREEYGYNKRRRAGVKERPYMSSGKKREPREWFSPSWYVSVEVLKNKMSDMVGESFSGAFDNL